MNSCLVLLEKNLGAGGLVGGLEDIFSPLLSAVHLHTYA
jgi:hypothetical protein